MTNAIHDRQNAMNALATLHGVLAEIGWDSGAADSEGAIFIEFGAVDFPVSDALAAIALKSERFILYLSLARNAPLERREQVAHLIGLINWHISIGSFEMDSTDGHVRFRTSIDFAGVRLDAQLIRNHILAGMRAMEAHFDALLQVIEGGSDVDEILRASSRTPHEHGVGARESDEPIP